MGNDGGTIAKRPVAVDLQPQPESSANDEYTLLTTCRISSLPLFDQAVVADYKGRLYLKEKILEYILQKKQHSKLPNEPSDSAKCPEADSIAHITSLKDITDVTLTWKTVDDKPCIECPVSHRIKTSNSEYAYLRTCGCVLSYKLLTEFLQHQCPQCDAAFVESDIVVVNPMDREVFTQVNTKNYLQLQADGLHHNKTAIKKRKPSSKSSRLHKAKKIKT